MKYLLIILLFVSSFCYGQSFKIRGSSGCKNCMTLEMRPIDTIDIPNNPYNLILKKDSLGRSVEANIISKHPLYDTTIGFVQIIDSKGLLVRGMGVKIDSLDIGYHYHGIPDGGYKLSHTGTGYDMAIMGNFIDTIRTTLKIYFDACDCLLDVKKWFNFIPIGMAQSFTIYEDEHISISPNENYKKDEK